MADDAPRRRKGRPPLDPNDRSVKVSFSVPSHQYDLLYRAASDRRVGVPELIRRWLQLEKKTATGQPSKADGPAGAGGK
jgi:hypothetical protein